MAASQDLRILYFFSVAQLFISLKARNGLGDVLMYHAIMYNYVHGIVIGFLNCQTDDLKDTSEKNPHEKLNLYVKLQLEDLCIKLFS